MFVSDERRRAASAARLVWTGTSQPNRFERGWPACDRSRVDVRSEQVRARQSDALASVRKRSLAAELRIGVCLV